MDDKRYNIIDVTEPVPIIANVSYTEAMHSMACFVVSLNIIEKVETDVGSKNAVSACMKLTRMADDEKMFEDLDTNYDEIIKEGPFVLTGAYEPEIINKFTGETALAMKPVEKDAEKDVNDSWCSQAGHAVTSVTKH